MWQNSFWQTHIDRWFHSNSKKKNSAEHGVTPCTTLHRKRWIRQLERHIPAPPFLATEMCFLSPLLLTVKFNEKRLGVSSGGEPPVTTSYYQCTHGIAGHALFLCRHICRLNVDKLLPVNKAAGCTWAENGHRAGGKLGGTHAPPRCAASL